MRTEAPHVNTTTHYLCLQEVREEHISVANDTPLPPKDMNQIMQAREDAKKLAQHVIFCKKRKAVPQDSLPVELLVALLAPNYIQKPAKQALQSMSDAIPTRSTYSDYSKPIHFVPGPAIPATEGRPEFHASTYKPPQTHQPSHQKYLCSTTCTHLQHRLHPTDVAQITGNCHTKI